MNCFIRFNRLEVHTYWKAEYLIIATEFSRCRIQVVTLVSSFVAWIKTESFELGNWIKPNGSYNFLFPEFHSAKPVSTFKVHRHFLAAFSKVQLKNNKIFYPKVHLKSTFKSSP